MNSHSVHHILVPTDFSETANHAIRHAARIAQKYRAALSILHVRESFGHDVIFPNIDADMNIENAYDEKARERLSDLALQIKEEYLVQANPILSVGRIAQETANYAKAEDVGLIVVGTHGTKGIEEFFLGSNAYRVVNSVKCPVLSVRDSSIVEYQNIIVPIDDTMHSREKLPYAVEFAKNYGASVKILMMYREDTTTYVERMNKVQAQVENYLDSQSVIYETHKIETTQIAKEIIQFSDYMKGDLVVIMSEQETTITGMLLGPFSQQVVNHSKIPVLTIKPKNNDTIVSELGSF